MNRLLLPVFIFQLHQAGAQSFIDIVQVNSQVLSTQYKHFNAEHTSRNHFLNLFVPKVLNNDRVAFLRFNAEMLKSSYESDSIKSEHTVYQLALPVGYQFPINKKGLSLTTMLLPRLSSDFGDKLSGEDFQMGAVALFSWKKNDKFRLRAGLFYNRECFGNFFVPLLGVDWKISKYLQIYGLLPQYYRVEFKLTNNFYTGIGMRFYGRSYRLADKYNDDYVWNQENQVKFFLDFYPVDKLVVYTEAGRSLGYGPYQVRSFDVRTRPAFNNPVYSSLNDSWFINFGAAYRIRN